MSAGLLCYVPSMSPENKILVQITHKKVYKFTSIWYHLSTHRLQLFNNSWETDIKLQLLFFMLMSKKVSFYLSNYLPRSNWDPLCRIRMAYYDDSWSPVSIFHWCSWLFQTSVCPPTCHEVWLHFQYHYIYFLYVDAILFYYEIKNKYIIRWQMVIHVHIFRVKQWSGT